MIVLRSTFERRENPSDAHDDRGAAYQHSVPDKVFQRSTGECMNNARQLQADQDEDEAVQDEHHHLPKHVCIEPRPRGEDLRHTPADKQPGSDYRQYPGGMQALRGNVSGKWRE
jgi:hypothetical protein